MDKLTKERRSWNMSRIRSSNTKPELIVRRYLFSKGFRYRIHQKNLKGKPDIVLKKYNAIIFINGCFWHGHKNCKNFSMPASRVNYWKPKIEKNVSKDIKYNQVLKRKGWRIFIIWECQLKKIKADLTLKSLERKILNY